MSESHISPYITALEEAALLHPDKVVFNVPICKEDERPILGWRNITYGQFYAKLGGVARYWTKTLELPPGSVVALWMAGLNYYDVSHIFGVMRAGYIPHLLSASVRDADVVWTLLKKSGARAVIHIPTVPVQELSQHLRCYPAIDPEEISVETEDTIFLNPKTIVRDEDIVAIVHTSGSTGRQKMVPLRRRWFRGVGSKVSSYENIVSISPRAGSYCHGGQLSLSLNIFQETLRVIMVPWMDISADEIIRMYNECGFTTLTQFAPILSRTIRSAETNAELLAILQSLHTVYSAGAALSEAEIEWCLSNKIPLQGVFAMVEAHIVMVQDGKDPLLFQLVKADGCSYGMFPISNDDAARQNRTETEAPLLELVILSDSLDCPDSDLCDPRDGHFHTKDLFEEVTPGAYKYRGRLDDMIKTLYGYHCDARYIEDQVYTLCKDLVSACVVVGSGKLSPALLVEPFPESVMDEQKLIRQIGDKLAAVNKNFSYPYQRITPDHILVLPPGKLPRTATKNNIKRAAAEAEFKDQIDALYT